MNKGKISCILAAAMITTQFSPVAAFADNKTELISNVSAEDSSNETKYDNTQSFDEEPVNDQNNNDRPNNYILTRESGFKVITRF